MVKLIHIKSVLTGLFLLASGLSLQAQVWTDGEIESVEIEIVKDREVSVPKASRNFMKVPPRPFEPIIPPITYQFSNISFTVPDINPSVRPLRLKQEELEKIYGNYIRLGYGNYVSPYVDASFNNKRDKEKFFGARVFHHSFNKGPVKEVPSGEGRSIVSVYGRTFGSVANMGGEISYDNRTTNFYGFPDGFDFTNVDLAALTQSFNRFRLKGDIANTNPSKFNYTLGSGFSYLSDNFNARESEVNFDLQSYFKFTDNTRLNLNSNYALISRKDASIEPKPRHLFIVSPSLFSTFLDNQLKLELGLNFAIENDTIGKEKDFHLYPNIKATYLLNETVEVYAGATGNMEKVSLQSLTHQNLWLAPDVPIFHANKTIEFFGGLNGKLGRYAGFGLGASASNYKHLYFFLNEGIGPIQFDVVYDEGNTSLLKLFTELSFRYNERFSFMSRAAFLNYITDTIDEAWHRPGFEFNAQARYNIFNKVILQAESFIQSGLTAFNYAEANAVKLDAAIDLNLKVDYLVSKRFSVFVHGNNLLNRSYPLFYQYPVRGVQVIGGFGYSF